MSAAILEEGSPRPWRPGELNEGSRERMLRGLALGNLCAVLFFAALIPVLHRVGIDKVTEVVMSPIDPHEIGPTPKIESPPDVLPPVRPTLPKEGIYRAVPREIPIPDAPPSDPARPATEPGTMTGNGDVVPREGTGEGEGTPTDPGVWIYREEEPVLVRQVTPEYPEMARITHLEGMVYVHALVGRDGRVTEVRIAKSSLAFDQAARSGPSVRVQARVRGRASGRSVGHDSGSIHAALISAI